MVHCSCAVSGTELTRQSGQYDVDDGSVEADDKYVKAYDGRRKGSDDSERLEKPV